MNGRGSKLHHTLLAAGLSLLASLGAAAANERQQLVEQFEEQARIHHWDEALQTAQQLLAQANGAPVELAHQLIEVQTLIGRAQLALNDNGAAEENFTAVLTLADEHLSAADARLLQPLAGLGMVYGRTDRHEQAVVILERALVIARRNRGLFDLQQAQLLKQLAESYTQLGAIAEAQRHMAYLGSVAERSYGEGDPRVVPTLCDIANWHSRVGDGYTARRLYRRAIALIEDSLGQTSIRMVDALRGLARSYERELLVPQSTGPRGREHPVSGFNSNRAVLKDVDEPRALDPRSLNPEGERALLRALKILEAQPEPASHALRRIVMDLGDWFQIKQEERQAFAYYARASALTPTQRTSADPSGDRFEIPVRLYYPMPPLALRHLHRSPEDVEERFVLVEFLVDRNGAVIDPQVLEKNASKRQVDATLDAIKQARYRPRLVNAEPTDTPGVRHRQVFRVLK